MTLKQFDELVQREKIQRESLDKELAALQERVATIDAEMNAAADAGEVETYRSLMKEKEDVEIALIVKRRQKNNYRPSVNEAVAQAAWSDYVSGHNRKLKKSLAEFEAEKAKLLSMYSELINMQSDACSVRERIGSAVGLPDEAFPMEYIPLLAGANEFGALRLSSFACADPDACYYLACYAAKNKVNYALPRPNPEMARVYNVVISKKPNKAFSS